MKTPTRRNILLLSCLSALLLTGCTRRIDVTYDMPVQAPPAKKLDGKLLVVMPKDQCEGITSWKQNQFADTWEFDSGRSISSNVLVAVKAMFATADLANEVPPGAPTYDYFLLVNYKDHKIDMGSSGFSDWTIKVYVDYELQDRQRNRVLFLATDGSYTRVRDTAEGIGSTIFMPLTLSTTYKRVGNTWDRAVASSCEQLMDGIKGKFLK